MQQESKTISPLIFPKTSCVLSDKDIVEELNDTVIIEPFIRSQVGPNSYDTRLGEYYYERDDNNIPSFFNPFSGEHISRFWGVTPDITTNYGAKKALTVTTTKEADKYDLKIGDKYILIKSGHIILAHTEEFVGSRGNVTTIMKSRSSIGRAGLTICSCAGSGDVGFFNRYTYEIHNRNPIPVILKVGDRIGQIIFMRTGEVLVSYEKSGQYQSSNNITELVNTWSPLSMIPKLGVEYIRSTKYVKPNKSKDCGKIILQKIDNISYHTFIMILLLFLIAMFLA
jgi:dCTP deaminase